MLANSSIHNAYVYMTIRIRQETKENHKLFLRKAEKNHLRYQFLAAGKRPVTLAINKL